jgi:hypothetical protein
MCYDDDATADGSVWSHGQLVPLAYPCAKSHSGLLDCGHDDYFSTDPDPNGWLAQHWNVANSSFLTSEGPSPVQDTRAPTPTQPRPTIAGRLGRRVAVRLTWRSKDRDVAGYWLWRQVDGRRWTYVSRPDLWENNTVVHLRRHHSYRFLVHAYDAAGNASAAVFGPVFRPRVFQERNRRVSYTGRWQRLYRRQASARHVATPRSTLARSRLAFRGRAVALVTPTSPNGGVVRARIDGRYTGRIVLRSDTATERQVVFSHRFKRRGRHRIAVRPAQGSGPAQVDAFVVLR